MPSPNAPISTNAKLLLNLEALETEAKNFITAITPNLTRATLITLSGDLGAGKTTFTQALARTLGVLEPVTSPTFVLQKIYPLAAWFVLDHSSSFLNLIHIDAYRLEGEKTLDPLKFYEYYADPKNLIILEWPEMVAAQIPLADTAITLNVLPDQSRSVSYLYG